MAAKFRTLLCVSMEHQDHNIKMLGPGALSLLTKRFRLKKKEVVFMPRQVNSGDVNWLDGAGGIINIY